MKTIKIIDAFTPEDAIKGQNLRDVGTMEISSADYFDMLEQTMRGNATVLNVLVRGGKEPLIEAVMLRTIPHEMLKPQLFVRSENDDSPPEQHDVNEYLDGKSAKTFDRINVESFKAMLAERFDRNARKTLMACLALELLRRQDDGRGPATEVDGLPYQVLITGLESLLILLKSIDD